MGLSITPGMIEWNTDDILAYLDAKAGNVVSPAVFRELIGENLQSYAFTVSRLADVEMIADVFDALTAWEKSGQTLASFQTIIDDMMDTAGWTRLSPWHVENIIRTNMATVYNAARYEYQMEVLDDLPLWLFSVIVDTRTTKDICLPLANPPIVLPGNHRWFWSHNPPLHFQCRSEIIALAMAQVKEMGFRPRASSKQIPKIDVDRAHGFGKRVAYADPTIINERIKKVTEALHAA